MNEIARTVWKSPVGPLTLGAVDGRLSHVLFAQSPGAEALARAPRDPDHPILAAAAAQLAEYFAGARREFDLPLAPAATPFQRDVRRALLGIGWGETISYGELARRVGRPRAVRAVGAANGRNPLSIVVPCHRVVGADGSLTGYGGGLEIKARLLALEGAEPREARAAG